MKMLKALKTTCGKCAKRMKIYFKMKNTLHLFEALSPYENYLEALFEKKAIFRLVPALVYAAILESSKNKNLFPNR